MYTQGDRVKDHFYVCQGHLKDRGFCSPVIDEAEVLAKKKKENMDREIEIVKKEYEEKLANKKKAKDKKNSKAEGSGEKKSDVSADTEAEKEKNDKVYAKAYVIGGR